MLLEICIDNLESARAAIRGGADRLEVCSHLGLDGLSPDPELIRAIQQESDIPLMAMVRPRPGDFIYTKAEIRNMQAHIQTYRDLGVAGVVLGCLRVAEVYGHDETPGKDNTPGKGYTPGKDNTPGKGFKPLPGVKGAQYTIDLPSLSTLTASADGLDITFHRAFDLLRDPFVAMEQLIDLKIPRILTSGLAPTAWEGRDLLKQLVQQAKGRITILAGAGIGPHNAANIIAHCAVQEIHGSAAEKRKTEQQPLQGGEPLDKQQPLQGGEPLDKQQPLQGFKTLARAGEVPSQFTSDVTYHTREDWVREMKGA